ncbi:hypothetical protein [Streptoalloteichus hindustanus]|nr:hypothetical protein [Streptoalloteichus hindustanus]
MRCVTPEEAAEWDERMAERRSRRVRVVLPTTPIEEQVRAWRRRQRQAVDRGGQ